MKIKLLFLLFPIFCIGQIPAYYSTFNFSLTGNNLKSQLTTLITNTHTNSLPYTASGTTDTWDALSQTDLDPTNSNNVLLIYGFNDTDADITNDRTRYKYAQCHTSSCDGLWVREHTFARSLGTPNLGFEDAGSDAHHLRAIDYDRNNLRSNRKFNVGSGNSTVLPNGNFYPGDEWKGDVARMMMYMYVRYPSQCAATAVGAGSTSFSNFGDMPNVFLQWNVEDPVSQYELNRNNILQGIQGNRNPFIDNPYLATLIWNGPSAPDSWGVLSIVTQTQSQFVVYPTVTSDYVYILKTESLFLPYSVSNNVGQVIMAGTTNEKIDLSRLPIGIYFINFKVGHAVKVIKK